jgi:hypothetical protein
VFDGFIGRVVRDVEIFKSKTWGILLFVVCLYAGWKVLETINTKCLRMKYWNDLPLPGPSVLALFVFAGFFLAARYSTASQAVLAVFLLSACCAIAVKSRLLLPLSLFLAYIAACAFLTALGLWTYDRVALTFSFLLHLGALILIAQSFEIPRSFEIHGDLEDETEARVGTALSWGVIVMLAGLYTCWAWWPNELRMQYLTKVEGRKMAVKTSDDKMLNRSLYFTGGHALVYTSADELMIGALRPYANFEYPTRFGNESFIHPNRFLEIGSD